MPTIKTTAIELPKLNIRTFRLTLIGNSSLLVHRWSEKARQQMLDKQMKKAPKAKEAKDPFRQFVDSLYWLSEKPKKPTPADVAKARFGFPVVAFKMTAVNGASFADGITKVLTRGAFHIPGEYVTLEGQSPIMREDMVRIAMGTADIRYRGEFPEWRVTFPIRYNPDVLSLEQILGLYNIAGFGVGVGEWRPQRGGSYGMFHVATDDELKKAKK